MLGLPLQQGIKRAWAHARSLPPYTYTHTTTTTFPRLQVKAGLALAHLGQTDQAVELFACLLSEPVEQFADLYADVGSLLLGMDRPEDALRFFRCTGHAGHARRVGWVRDERRWLDM